ncbi:hypothetical protein JOQ06_007454 [Pogonophryne albipinna]|uniref:DUF4371 domain-containing protein n=1 Tax=Pogonophryne albipinna TaxID=1090488 RepID=A0AAD6B1R0_9TELE|nr:hypothetical protein JOQ06_007454 [Pogonophryne albipinna]
MSGRISGVQAKLKGQCPSALYVHCSNHALDLVLQEVAREVCVVADTLNFVRSVSVVVGESSKRKMLFLSMFGDDEAVCNLLSLCPTRWAVRTRAISRVVSSYTALLQTLKMLEQDKTVRGDTRAKESGLYKQATKAKTYFGLLCCEALFGPCETVARALQSEKASAKGALECVSALRQRMHGLREDGFIQEMTAKVTACAERNNLKMPLPPRTNRTPARLRDTEETEAIVTDVGEQQWRREFYEALDLVTTELDRRFDQEGLQVAALREQTVINAANGEYSGMREITAAQLKTLQDSSEHCILKPGNC